MKTLACYYNQENHFKFELNYSHIIPHNSLLQITYIRPLNIFLFILSLIINTQIPGLINKGKDNQHY